MKPNKYHSKKITVEGQTFDSKKEYLKFKELELLERAGKIQNLKRQVEYLLIPAQFGMMPDPKTGRMKRVCLERACTYKADFTYNDESGKLHVVDVKGYKGGGAYSIFKIKKKLMLQSFGILVEEV